ncbi:DUF1573 domain-containing protein [Prevotella sp.]|uniref:DUF1573 domain-containing protein n=1 Tax=Prevotella sp. TaxID=59823 RepID=UPI00307880E9
MMKRKTISSILAAVVTLALTSLTSGCERRILPTALCVTDSVRHYYPIVAGEKLNFSFVLRNIGDSPLLLDDIQPSCGCIVGKLTANVIPPHDSLTVAFTFDSSKNVGYVKHAIRLYGNILPRGMATLVFDVNVVPPSDHDPDYEEVFHEQKAASSTLEELVDGKPSEKGYYVEPDASTDSRSHSKFPWRE